MGYLSPSSLSTASLSVSMSYLLNTISANAMEYCGIHDRNLLQKARHLSRMPDFAEHSVITIFADYGIAWEIRELRPYEEK